MLEELVTEIGPWAAGIMFGAVGMGLLQTYFWMRDLHRWHKPTNGKFDWRQDQDLEERLVKAIEGIEETQGHLRSMLALTPTMNDLSQAEHRLHQSVHGIKAPPG